MSGQPAWIRLIVLILCCQCLFGCAEHVRPAASAQIPEQDAAQALEEVVLTRWVSLTGNSEISLRTEARFAEQHPNIRLNNVLVADGTDYATAFASGINPDIGMCGMPDMAMFAYTGMAMQLDEYIDRWPEAKNIFPQAMQAASYKGSRYALPAYGYTMMLYYNKALFEQAGIEAPPATWEELLDTAKRLTVHEEERWGFNLLMSQWREWWFEYFVWQAGGDLTVQNPDDTMTLTFDDPAVLTAVEFYRELIRERVTQPDLTINYESMQMAFANGNAAMTLNGSDGIATFIDYGMDVEQIGMANLPVGPSGEPVTQLGGQCMFVFSNVPQRTLDAAWSWMTFSLSSEERENILIEERNRGGASPSVPIRDDVNTSLGGIKPEFQRAVDRSLAFARQEFYGKGFLCSYVDAAIYRAVMDPSCDVLEVFAEQQAFAQREAVDPFNRDMLALN